MARRPPVELFGDIRKVRTARPGARGIAGLRHEVLRHVVEKNVIVVLYLAQLEKVLRCARTLAGVQVDNNVAHARLQQNCH